MNGERRDAQRCFLGFELTRPSRAYLRELAAPLHRKLSGEMGWPLRLLPEGNWHATLLFFPGLDGKERERVWEEVEAIARSGIWDGLEFPWQGLSLWPAPRRPNLICLEAPLHEEARRWPLAGWMDRDPFAKGNVAQFLRYRPHITLMRFRKGGRGAYARDWKALAGELPRFDAGRIAFGRLSFFLSTLSPGQPLYPRERTVSLAGDPSG